MAHQILLLRETWLCRPGFQTLRIHLTFSALITDQTKDWLMFNSRICMLELMEVAEGLLYLRGSLGYIYTIVVCAYKTDTGTGEV